MDTWDGARQVTTLGEGPKRSQPCSHYVVGSVSRISTI